MSVNKVILLGYLGGDPELRTTGSGDPVANFNLATSEKYKDKEITQWHTCAAFGKLAEIIHQYLSKGSQVYVEGSIRYQEWEKDGQKRTATQIKIDKMTMLGSKGKSKKDDSDEIPW